MIKRRTKKISISLCQTYESYAVVGYKLIDIKIIKLVCFLYPGIFKTNELLRKLTIYNIRYVAYD